MRMQRSQGLLQKSERYSMDQGMILNLFCYCMHFFNVEIFLGSQDDIKQFLAMQHKGMTHLIDTVNTDISHLKLIHEGMNKIVHEAE